MRFAYYLRNNNSRIQTAVVRSFSEGCRALGEQFRVFGKEENQLVDDDIDVLVFYGIGGDAKGVQDAYRTAGKRIVLLDKGYIRNGFIRVAVDAFQPLDYFQRTKRPIDRWRALNLKPETYELKGSVILFDGASNKYCLWCDLPPHLDWGQMVIDTIKRYSSMPIIYRPRPSHNPVTTLKGATTSQEALEFDLHRAAVVVSHGGNLGFDAVLAGRPHFALGTSIARPVSETVFEHIDRGLIPAPAARQQWFNDLAYCQWSLDEFRSGVAVRYVRDMLDQVSLINHLKTKYPEGAIHGT
jgi:hypothetical protein